ncbi:hypothetical protein SAY87_018035 [Trapa incisa]|uniref:X8 domain-containing protein n=1 Tax=Trapa incisa TaxID=236973 RepID=A0AAN7L7M2_9MYRT|nr:hypothetical protein SAY87_018035 [Trapa incisa]
MALFLLLPLLLLVALTGPSSATYCVCKDGQTDQVLQKTLDYACGAGADCSPILQSGACYQPNTIKNHCDYAVNSYYQRKGQTTGSCDFAGTATPTTTVPTAQTTTCIYPSSPSTTAGNSTTPPPPSTTPTTSTNTTNATTTTTTTTTPPISSNGPTGIASTAPPRVLSSTRWFSPSCLAATLCLFVSVSLFPFGLSR